MPAPVRLRVRKSSDTAQINTAKVPFCVLSWSAGTALAKKTADVLHTKEHLYTEVGIRIPDRLISLLLQL